MNTKHTPGPWTADNADGQFYGVFDQFGGALAYLVETPDMESPKKVTTLPCSLNGQITQEDAYKLLNQHKANARLIAAAPELLAALRYSVKQMAAFIGDRGIDHPMYVALIEARAAIAKAEGK